LKPAEKIGLSREGGSAEGFKGGCRAEGYLEQDIEREVYREQKAVLLSEKKSLDEKMARIEQKQNDWLEPMKEWIKVSSNLVKIARDSNLLEKKVATKEIFGSNLRLASHAVRGEPVFSYISALRAAKSVAKNLKV
jgi:hypothetical protein